MEATTETHVHTILVAGATGYIGGRLIPVLLEQRAGVTIRALCRNPDKLQGRSFADDDRVVAVAGDVLDAASLTPALDGVDVAYYLVHSLASAGADFDDVDIRAAQTFGEACAQAGVQRIIYLSGLGADGDDLSLHLRSRQNTGDALREAGVPVTELRAAIVVGSGSASFEIVHDLARKLPVMITPRWVQSRCEPIAIRDVVSYLIGVLDEPRSIGEVLEIGSGEQLSYADMMRILSEELGRTLRIITVPVLTPRLSSYWLHLVTSVDMQIARPLIEGLRNDVVCHDTRITEWIPLDRSPYRLAVQRALRKVDMPTVRESRWTDANPRLDVRAQSIVAEPSRVRIAPATAQWRDYHSFDTDLSPDELFARIGQIGGENGYGPAADVLWRLRGALDRAVGGTGLRRGRPFGNDLHEGDALDFWRVEHVDAPRELVLIAEMLVPGTARLRFEVEELGGGRTRLHQLATLSNDNVFSGLYWLSIKPLHGWVFQRLGEHVVGREHLVDT